MTETMTRKEVPTKGISRRDFNKILASGVVLFFAETAGLGAVLVSKEGKSPLLDAKQRYPQEIVLYGAEGVRFIDTIEQRLHLVVALPGTFSILDNFDTTKVIPNAAWYIGELEALAEVAQKLPSRFVVPDRTVLGVVRGDYAGYGGSQTESKIPGNISIIALFAPRNWEPQHAASEPGIWQNTKEEMQAIFIHELTHEVIVRDEALLNRYAQVVGWKQRDTRWVYEGGESFVWKLVQKREDQSHQTPTEDLATVSMLYGSIPNLLGRTWNESDQKRFEFVKQELYTIQ